MEDSPERNGSLGDGAPKAPDFIIKVQRKKSVA